MPAPLENFLHLATSGEGVFTPEMWQHAGGDQLLAELRKYDPNASIEMADIGGGEGGGEGKGIKLNLDYSKLPSSKQGTIGYDLRPDNFSSLKRPDDKTADAAYGGVTNSDNIIKPHDPLWTKLAPLVVSIMAPVAGAALAAEGIGAGVTAGAAYGAGAGAEVGGAASGSIVGTGGTGAVTGSGVTGVNSMGLPTWAIKAISKAPQIARSISNGSFNPVDFGAGVAGDAAGIDPKITSGALTLARLSRQRNP
jgi:hypothetical protein